MSGRLALVAVLLLAACAARGDGVREHGGDEVEKRARIEAMYEDYQREFPEVRTIDVPQLAEELSSADPPVLVDVRTDEERAVSVIPGAISQQEFEARRDELRGREVVTYCTIGYRSGLYADELRREGWDVANLRGSILAWTYGDGELEADGKPTHRVHVYGRKWNLAADGFEAVW